MVHIGNKSFGFFYSKNKTTFVEFGGKTEVKVPSEMAKTATKKVVLLLGENGEVLDMDDLPTTEAVERSLGGGTFISFVEHENTHVFVINEEAQPSSKEIEGESFLEVFADNFNLTACLADNDFVMKDLEAGEFLVVFAEGEIVLDKEKKTVRLPFVEALIKKAE